VDLTDAGFDGALGSNYDNVVVTVTKAGALLSGVVRDQSGRAAAGAVMLFPVDPKRWLDYGLTPDRLRVTGADSAGAYKFQPVPTGDYFVIAVPPGQASGWLDPKFLAAASAQAVRMSLTTSASKTQDLRLSEVIIR
jgi:hypothetical protein